MRYRVYLFDRYNRIKAAETFVALDDAEALEMGAVLFQSADDVFSTYELWSGSRHVTGASPRRQLADDALYEMSERRQHRMLELEERLLASFACIRQSREMLAATTRLLAQRHDRFGRPINDSHDL